MRVNKAMLMIRLVNRITAERDYWKEKVEAQLKGKGTVAMDTINRLTQRGEWFVGSEWHYEIQKDELNPVDGQPRFVRDIMIKCVETGTLVLYRMIESPLNSMYISK